MNEPKFKLEILFGYMEFETRMRPEGRKIIGEGRRRHVHRDGRKEPWTEWEPTGCTMTWPDDPPAPRPWWKFW